MKQLLILALAIGSLACSPKSDKTPPDTTVTSDSVARLDSAQRDSVHKKDTVKPISLLRTISGYVVSDLQAQTSTHDTAATAEAPRSHKLLISAVIVVLLLAAFLAWRHYKVPPNSEV